MRTIATIALVLCLVACTPRIVHKPVALPLPPRPLVQAVQSSAVQCLAPATYTTLVERERALKTWGLKLEAVIKANNARAHTRK